MVFKILHVVLLASVKYIFTLPYAMVIGLDYQQAIIAVLAGGIGGFLIFYYLSKPLVNAFHILWAAVCSTFPKGFKHKYEEHCDRRNREKKIFSRRSRMIVRIKATYGFWGIIFTTPFLLTIPVGAFLASRYYSHRKHIVLYMIMSIIGWGAVLSGVVHLFPNVFF